MCVLQYRSTWRLWLIWFWWKVWDTWDIKWQSNESRCFYFDSLDAFSFGWSILVIHSWSQVATPWNDFNAGASETGSTIRKPQWPRTVVAAWESSEPYSLIPAGHTCQWSRASSVSLSWSVYMILFLLQNGALRSEVVAGLRLLD